MCKEKEEKLVGNIEPLNEVVDENCEECVKEMATRESDDCVIQGGCTFNNR